MTTQKHDLVTPYMAMAVTRDNSMLMASPTSSHLMLRHLEVWLGSQYTLSVEMLLDRFGLSSKFWKKS